MKDSSSPKNIIKYSRSGLTVNEYTESWHDGLANAKHIRNHDSFSEKNVIQWRSCRGFGKQGKR